MAQGNIWSVSPATNATYYRVAASIAGAGALTLLQSTAGSNGIGYKVTITSAGDDSGDTFTIVGHAMGTAPGIVTTEAVTGSNAGVATSTNYYDSITSITVSGASAGNVSIGVLGTSVALPRTRIKGLYYVATGSAGSVAVNLNSTSGRLLVKIDTPASATVANSSYIPEDGILVAGSAATDFGLVTLTNVTFSTIYCG
jgi:hypothetical protein